MVASTSAQKLVTIALSIHGTLSKEELATITGLSERTIRRVINNFEKIHLITKETLDKTYSKKPFYGYKLANLQHGQNVHYNKLNGNVITKKMDKADILSKTPVDNFGHYNKLNGNSYKYDNNTDVFSENKIASNSLINNEFLNSKNLPIDITIFRAQNAGLAGPGVFLLLFLKEIIKKILNILT